MGHWNGQDGGSALGSPGWLTFQQRHRTFKTSSAFLLLFGLSGGHRERKKVGEKPQLPKNSRTCVVVCNPKQNTFFSAVCPQRDHAHTNLYPGCIETLPASGRRTGTSFSGTKDRINKELGVCIWETSELVSRFFRASKYQQRKATSPSVPRGYLTLHVKSSEVPWCWKMAANFWIVQLWFQRWDARLRSVMSYPWLTLSLLNGLLCSSKRKTLLNLLKCSRLPSNVQLSRHVHSNLRCTFINSLRWWWSEN